MDVTVNRLVFFVDGNYFVKQFFEPNPFRCNGWDDRYPNHFSQSLMVEFRPRFFKLVEHVQHNYHFNVHVDELGGEEKIPLKVRGIDHIHYNIGQVVGNVLANEKFLGAVLRNRIGAGQVG